jgi:hypothetical protein
MDYTYKQIIHIDITATTKDNKLFKKVIATPNNSFIGIDTNNDLYYMAFNSNKGPFQAMNSNIKIIDIVLCPDNSLYGVGSDSQLYTLTNYLGLNAQWQPVSPPVRNIKAIAISQTSTKTNSKLYAIMSDSAQNGYISYLEDWNQLNEPWIPLGSAGCCYQSISSFLLNPIFEINKCNRKNKSEMVNSLIDKINTCQSIVEANKKYFESVGEELPDLHETNQKLSQSYKLLLDEKRKINDTLDTFGQLDEEVISHSSFADSRGMLFRILFVVVIILIIYIVGEMVGNDGITNNSLFTFFMACVLLASVGLFKGTFGFMLFGLLCLVLVLFVTGIVRF